MSEPRRDEAAAPPPSADPTVQVQPPPVPGRAVRAQLAAGEIATPPVRPDEPTVTLDGPAPADPGRTQELDVPARVQVTVGPRPRPRRRWRTWPWIVAVVLALVVLGAVLVTMLWRGATIDSDVDLVGRAGGATGTSAGPGGG
ncbi:hypothetical protein [Geodermatophilus sp. DSM 45219]|uniref:hypothetical protein n=1 Tax=Geodermatophilus sp. DSM 45219 TaxID=1881103 RepID=UPI0008926C0C|nr:hypothetical protein [Geodermatophilus sp. DSM 45219]SDO18842.1 hypothetical protein SAMN05428965_3081 [Geodermatophilus sp. DSM 45219]